MSRKSFRLLLYVLLGIMFLIAVLPFVFTWNTAFKTKAELINNVFGLPQIWQWGNIGEAWIQGHFGTYYKNSVIVVIPVVIFSILLSMMNAYFLNFYRSRFNKPLLAFYIFGMTLPMEVVMVRLYFFYQSMGMLNSLWALIGAQIAMSLPFGTFLMFSAMRDFPLTLIEAAVLDGAGGTPILFKILSPLLKPTIVALCVFFFIWTWNEFLLTLVLIKVERLRTLPIGMSYFQGRYVGNAPLTAMGATLMSIPVIMIYIALQRYFIAGLTSGALKE